MEAFNPDSSINKEDFADDDGVFIEVMDRLRSGKALWLPRAENPDIIDFFKYKKYQGAIELVDIDQKLFNAYRVNIDSGSDDPVLINSYPISFDYAALLLETIASD